jgi:hypothetical protein
MSDEINTKSERDNPFAFPADLGGDGMTLLDYFAGQALAGMLAYSYCNPARGNYNENCSVPDAVGVAYQYAVAMLKERQKHL